MAREREREAVKSVYPNAAWRRKVDHWQDDQVFAVYMRLKNQNKL